MSQSELPALLSIMQARYQSEQQAFQKLVAEENRLRSDLRQIDAQARESDHGSNAGMRAIGADVIWKAWVGKTKRALNIQLAQVLAQKEHHIQKVKKSYGKVLVTQELQSDFIAQNAKDKTRNALSRAIEQSLYSPKRRQ